MKRTAGAIETLRNICSLQCVGASLVCTVKPAKVKAWCLKYTKGLHTNMLGSLLDAVQRAEVRAPVLEHVSHPPRQCGAAASALTVPRAAALAALNAIAAGANNGGAVSALDHAHIFAHNCSFSNNGADFGGAMLLFTSTLGMLCVALCSLVWQSNTTILPSCSHKQHTPLSILTPYIPCVTRQAHS